MWIFYHDLVSNRSINVDTLGFEAGIAICLAILSLYCIYREIVDADESW